MKKRSVESEIHTISGKLIESKQAIFCLRPEIPQIKINKIFRYICYYFEEVSSCIVIGL